MEDIIEKREDWGRIDMVEFVLSMVVTVGPRCCGAAGRGVVVLPRTSALIERHHE